MIKAFAIDFIRATFEQTLLEQHIKNDYYLGGKNQVGIFSMYEQLVKGEDVDRYVAGISDLLDQQNRSNLILNGVVTAPSNPTITNLYSCTIIPMEYVCSLICQVRNRDQVLETINNMINELKGTKVDIAELKCESADGNGYSYVPFVVGTIGHNDGEGVKLKNGDYIGDIDIANIGNRLTYFESIGIYDDIERQEGDWYYFGNTVTGKLSVAYFNGENFQVLEDDGTHHEIIFPPEHVSFEKYKMSLSIEAIRCDDPKNLNSKEYVAISFGGSATLQNARVRFGNDMVKLSIEKKRIIGETNIVYSTPKKYWLEPLEMPAGNNANTKISQLVSNGFINNTHTDAVSVNLQYTFIADSENQLLEQLFDYSRYGTININSSDDKVTMSPNLEYGVTEYYSWWGNVQKKYYLGKLIESVDNDITEGDTMTISVTMQRQGANT